MIDTNTNLQEECHDNVASAIRKR